jgi:hypothetical protein
MAGAFFFHVVVVVGANEAPVLRRLGEGWPKLPSPLDTLRNYSTVAHYVVDTPPQFEPTKTVPSLPLLGDRLRPTK